MTSTGTPATRLLAAAGVEHRLHAYVVDAHAGSYGLAAARAIGAPPERMHKTLLARCDGRLVCAVVPVSNELDMKALAAAVGAKRATMAEPADAERASGYVVGGISPLGQRTTVPMVVDETVELDDTVFVSGGRRGLSVELAPADLIRLTSAVVADLAR